MVPRLARGRLTQAPGVLAIGALAASAALLGGCGGGARQDHSEKAGTYAMEVVHASFPAKQALAKPAVLELQVRNTGKHPVGSVAVTIDSFNYTSKFVGLAADKRPAWAIERGPGPVANPAVSTQEVSQPGGGSTAYVNTWALGRLAAGQTQTFVWHVIPLQAGSHTVHYSISAGLAGKAKATLASGGVVGGKFQVSVAPAPADTHVDPNTGQVVPGAAPPPGAP